MYWTWILVIVVAIILLWSFYRHTYEYFVNPAAYYQQHSRYPAGAWWISQNQPCHSAAREQCYDQFCYDNCYDDVLRSCTQSKTPPDLLPYQVTTKSPSVCQ